MRNNLDRLGAELPAQDNTAEQVAAQQPAQQLSFIVPTELVDLPSKGRFYPPSHPLRGKDTIEIKQMTAKEEDILTSKNLLKKGVALDKLLQSLILDKKINSDSLTLEDRSAIILAARISAYGQDYSTTVTCPSCGGKTKDTFDLLEKLDSVEQMQPASVDEDGLFNITLPKTGWKVKCRVLNGFDEKEMMRLASSKKNLSDGDSQLTDQMKMTVVSINGVSDPSVLKTAIESLPARDSKYLRTAYQDTVKGVDMRHTFKCGSCEYQGELEVPLTADFFWFK
jgi:transcription elongation factor Elf1